MTQQKIIPNLWFDKQSKEAAKFYVSVFGNNSGVDTIINYSDEGKEIHGMDAGTVMTVDFHIRGFKFVALNGGPHFTFTPAISFFVNCRSKEEVDELWEELAKGGTALMPLDSYPFSERYGWIEDKYGLSWQLIYYPDKAEQEIIPSLMFVGENAGKAEEAMSYYTNQFQNSGILNIHRYGADQPDDEDTVAFADFRLENQIFAIMDSAQDHDFMFNEAISLMVSCKTQKEIDEYWKKLSADPKSEQCGWLKDKFGVSWQIVPQDMNEMLKNEDEEKVKRVMRAMLQMKKIKINALNEAFEKDTPAVH